MRVFPSLCSIKYISHLVADLLLPGLYILLLRRIRIPRGARSERMVGVMRREAAPVTGSETGLAPRVAKFQ